MLYTETVAPKTLELLKRIMQDTVFSRFLLVGGTALSLQLGHRTSVDLDLFCKESFDENKLADYLRTEYNFELDYIDKETVNLSKGVKEQRSKGAKSCWLLIWENLISELIRIDSGRIKVVLSS